MYFLRTKAKVRPLDDSCHHYLTIKAIRGDSVMDEMQDELKALDAEYEAFANGRTDAEIENDLRQSRAEVQKKISESARESVPKLEKAYEEIGRISHEIADQQTDPIKKAQFAKILAANERKIRK